MNQKKIGWFMKELRNEKQITQEQLSEVLGVSNRTISRWETGNNMPDIVLLMEISDFYNIDIRELLSGERKKINIDEKSKETILKVTEYDNEENLKKVKKMNRISVVGILSMMVYLILLSVEPTQTPLYDFITGLTLGLSLGAIIVTFIFTSRYGAKIRAYKLRILEKLK